MRVSTPGTTSHRLSRTLAQARPARDDEPQGCSTRPVELLDDAVGVGLAQVPQEGQRLGAEVGAGAPEVLRPDREGLPVVRPGLLDLARVGDE